MVRDSQRSMPMSPAGGVSLLSLARDGSEAARARIAGMAPEVVASGLFGLTPKQRVACLEVVPQVEQVVPLIPEAELTHTIREVGLADAGWLIEFASGEQREAAIDLDCWHDGRFSASRFGEWLDAIIEAGPETLVAAFQELDIEVWVLALKRMASFRIHDGLDEDAPPDPGREAGMDGDTEDGLIYYAAHSEEAESRVRTILRTALEFAPSLYWAFAYGAMGESERDAEAEAARWHAGRMNDLGFPDHDQAMRAYRPLHVEAAPVVDVGEASAEPHALMTTSALPQRLAGTAVGRALAEMAPDRASEVLGYVLGVANSLAVADGLPLADLASVERSLGKAIRGLDVGLAALASAHGVSERSVLERTPPLDVFRVGATLDPGLARPRGAEEFDPERDLEDWNVESEAIGEADRALGPDGRPR